MVGLSGFEPPTSPTPKECATGLRHSPNPPTLAKVGKRIKPFKSSFPTFDTAFCFNYSRGSIGAYSSVGRALHWQCRGQRFDPA
jgi:hypothetical protein